MRTGRAVAASVVAVLSLAPVAVEAARAPTPTADWEVVSAGGEHTCAIRTNGRLYCWGRDVRGQLGDDEPFLTQPLPVQVAGGHTDWEVVSAGGNHTCAIRAGGRLFCFGLDDVGQLGDDSAHTDHGTPVEVAGGFTDWEQVTTGTYHTCGLRSTGQLYCWGLDFYGQLGNSTTRVDKPTPVQVFGQATDWEAVDAGSFTTCARKTSGRLFCFGADDGGQLGNDTTLRDQPVPVEVDRHLTNWTTFSVGGDHTCARKTSGRLFCWGRDGRGQLGNDPTLRRKPIPVEVFGGATDWASVAAGISHTCARKTNGRLYCFGIDSAGQLGNSTNLVDKPTPAQVFGQATDWDQVDSGGLHSCAVKTDDRLFCWGWNHYAQLGGLVGGEQVPTPSEVSG